MSTDSKASAHNNLDESQSYRINFQLNSPIQCENPHVLCNVVLQFTNPLPEEVSIVPCILEWSRDEWSTTKYVIVTALEDFVDDGDRASVKKSDIFLPFCVLFSTKYI